MIPIYLSHLSRRTAQSPVAPPPPPPSGDITVSLVASRTSGPAPLAVHFSAIDTTSTISGVTDPLRQLLYEFDYGDSGAGVWTVTGGSKNVSIGGPLGAHVFETPGVYTVRCTATREASTGFQEVTITVQDPSVVYPGAQTIFVSPSGNFSGAPAGAQTVTSIPAIVSNRRYLLRPGESFGAVNVPHGVSNVQISAAPGISGSKPIIPSAFIGEVGQPPDSNFPFDVSLIGLQCNGTVTQSSAARRLLFHKLDMPNTCAITINSAAGYWADPSRFGPSMPHMREVFISEVFGRGTTSTDSLTGDMIQSAMLGCDLMYATQHTVRVWRAWQFFMEGCAIRGVSSDGIRHALKLHGSGSDAFPGLGSTYGDSNSWATRYVAIQNNLFGDPADNNSLTVVLGPQNSVVSEGLEDCWLSGNRYRRGASTLTDLNLAGRRMTHINEVLDAGGAASVSAPGLHNEGLPSGWNGPYYNNRT